MGFIKKMLGQNRGWQCKRNEDGTETCPIIENDGKKIVATGSVANVFTDPNSCEAVITDGSRILEEDEQTIAKMLAQKKASCQRGIQ